MYIVVFYYSGEAYLMIPTQLLIASFLDIKACAYKACL